MDPRGFCRQTRLVIVAGKGGVGKTTVSAAMARMASRLGLSCLIVEVEGRSSLAATFGLADQVGYDEQVLAPASEADGTGEIRARTLTPDRALIEYLEDHGLGRTSRRLVRSGALDVVSTGAPGIKDILVLGKVKQLESMAAADLIVLDTPAAGHAVTFLMSARGLLDAVNVGPIQTQAADVLELLTDASRCQVMLVTLPEETPVNEVVETAFALEERVGADLGPVVVNGLYPALGLDADPAELARAESVELAPKDAEALRRAADFRTRRHGLQEEQVLRLAEALPLPQLRLPAIFAADLGRPELDKLADAMLAAVEALEPARP
ncbi:MAG TPA: ArsA-related P-loop ATPase [Acidimicrobiales bacterium]|nr:ArsA-related P-loop ATPase [Acidimicrobiales bacterium]